MKEYKSPMPEITIKYKSGQYKKTKIGSSSDSVTVFREVFNSDTIEYTEELCVLFLNGAHNTIGWTKHSSGGICQTVVDIKVILTQALLCGASAIIIAHNHPSGDMYPSREDDHMTKRLKAACETIDLRFLDHVILSGADNLYYSYADEGKI